jgi:hypothetical protein
MQTAALLVKPVFAYLPASNLHLAGPVFTNLLTYTCISMYVSMHMPM